MKVELFIKKWLYVNLKKMLLLFDKSQQKKKNRKYYKKRRKEINKPKRKTKMEDLNQVLNKHKRN